VTALVADGKTVEFVILLATAGARDLIKDKSQKMTLPNVCEDVAKTHASLKCVSSVMAGALEGYLGWYDAVTTKNDKTYCYVEFGGASAQFVHPIKGNVEVHTLTDTDFVNSLSGVSMGYNQIVAADPNGLCDCNHKAFNSDTCFKNVVNTQIIEQGKSSDNPLKLYKYDLGDCLMSYYKKRETAGTKCTKILARGLEANQWIYNYVTAAKVPDDKGPCEKTHANCKATDAKFHAEYNCARAMMWRKWFSELDLTGKSFEVAAGSEWYQGLIKLLIDMNFNVDAIIPAAATMWEKQSDCTQISIHATG